MHMEYAEAFHRFLGVRRRVRDSPLTQRQRKARNIIPPERALKRPGVQGGRDSLDLQIRTAEPDMSTIRARVLAWKGWDKTFSKTDTR